MRSGGEEQRSRAIEESQIQITQHKLSGLPSISAMRLWVHAGRAALYADWYVSTNNSCRASGHTGDHPRPAAMRVDDRTAKRDPSRGGLRRVESVEEPPDVCRSQARAQIHHRDEHAFSLGFPDADKQVSRSPLTPMPWTSAQH